MNKAKKAGTIAISICLWVIILIAALYAVTVLVNKDGQNVSSIAGFTPMVVESNSMAPTFEKDDMIIVKKCDTTKLEEGDIVCFHTIIDNKYALNTHRIVKITGEGDVRYYTTRGDNNDMDDQHIISDGDIVGKHVSTLPKMGKIMNFLSSSMGFLIIIVLPMLLFFIYQLYHLITVIIALKKATALEAIEEEAKAKLEAEAKARLEAERKAEEDKKSEASEKSEDGKTVEAAEKTQTPITTAEEALKAKAEAEAALAEAMRIKAEAEAALAKANQMESEDK